MVLVMTSLFYAFFWAETQQGERPGETQALKEGGIHTDCRFRIDVEIS